MSQRLIYQQRALLAHFSAMKQAALLLMLVLVFLSVLIYFIVNSGVNNTVTALWLAGRPEL